MASLQTPALPERHSLSAHRAAKPRTHQSFKTLASSTSSDSRLRKMAMMIPKPTAASAAATVITIKTNNCPVTSRKKLEKATNVRFTALSISSMHMNIEITLRLIITPTTPIVNSTADSARYHESCGAINRTLFFVLGSLYLVVGRYVVRVSLIRTSKNKVQNTKLFLLTLHRAGCLFPL